MRGELVERAPMPAQRRPIPVDALDALIALTRRQGGLFRWDQAVGLGITPSQARTMLRTGEWCKVRHGVLATSRALAEHGAHVLACAARWLDLPNDVVVTAESAGVLHGLPYVEAPAHPVLAIARPRRGVVRAPRPGALPDHHVEQLFGIPVTTTARTVADLLRRASDRHRAQALADGALRSGVRREDIEAVLAECSGWPGIRQAREAVRYADARAESHLESEHRVLLRDRGLPAPELQAVIRDRRGRWVARVDFLFREQRTVVESDGKVKYVDTADQPRMPREEVWHEKRREDTIRAEGLEVVRAYSSDRADGGADLHERVLRAFERAARRAG